METIKNLICEIIKYLENNQLNKGDKEISKYLKKIPLESTNFNELDSNKVMCSRPSKQTFKCSVYKHGELITSNTV